MAFAAEVWATLTLETRARLQAYMPLTGMNGKKAQTELRWLLTEAVRSGELIDPVTEQQFDGWFNEYFTLAVPFWARVENVLDPESLLFGLPIVATCACGRHEVSLEGNGNLNGVPVQGFLIRGDAMRYFCRFCRAKLGCGLFMSHARAAGKLQEIEKARKRERKRKKHPFLKVAAV